MPGTCSVARGSWVGGRQPSAARSAWKSAVVRSVSVRMSSPFFARLVDDLVVDVGDVADIDDVAARRRDGAAAGRARRRRRRRGRCRRGCADRPWGRRHRGGHGCGSIGSNTSLVRVSVLCNRSCTAVLDDMLKGLRRLAAQARQARSRPRSGSRCFSSGPCSRPVSASRKGWNSALPLRPVGAFSASIQSEKPAARSCGRCSAAAASSSGSVTTGASGRRQTSHHSRASSSRSRLPRIAVQNSASIPPRPSSRRRGATSA